MVRVLTFFAVVFVVAMGFAWLADRPGMVSIDWQGYRIDMGLMTLMILLALLMVVVSLVWSALRSVLRSPEMVSSFFRRRRRDRGYRALSKGLIALGAGDARSAGRHGHDARKLLKTEPAARLLQAQSAQMSGNRAEARALFEEMLEDEETRVLGLHGLFVEAERQNEPLAARHYAEEAHKLTPGLPWAGKAVLTYQAAAHDWEKAIVTLERNAHAKLIDKPTFRRQKAVLLTARAMELEDHEPDRARTLAMEAHGLAPDLVPAAVIAGRLLTRRGDVRKATKVLEATWKHSPHPDIAEAYGHVRPGDSARDRLKRVIALNGQRGHHVEGSLAIARAAIHARDWELAREHLRPLLRAQPTQRVFLLMADLEEGEHGDRGRMREWLSRAVRAPRDPAWTADGIVVDSWAPVSPLTGRLDAFEWRSPVERLAGPDEAGEEPLDLPADWPAPGDADAARSPVETLKPEAMSPQAAGREPPTVEATAARPETGAKDATAAVVTAARKTPETTEVSAAPATPKAAETAPAPKQGDTSPATPADLVKARVAQRRASAGAQTTGEAEADTSGKQARAGGATEPADTAAPSLAALAASVGPAEPAAGSGASGTKPDATASGSARVTPLATRKGAAAGADGDDGNDEIALPRPPDDPGVESDEDTPQRSRSLF